MTCITGLPQRLSLVFVSALLWACFALPQSVRAQEPGWYPRVIAPPEIRQQIQATPIELRPYRPLHFWGNSVRRTVYRGSPLPLPQDLYETSNSLLFSRPLIPMVPALGPQRR